MKIQVEVAVLAGVLVLQGCSVLPARPDGWVTSLPDQQYFSRTYESDAANAAVQTREEYLGWVRSFYEGSELYPWGFLDLESNVIDGTDADTAMRLKAKLGAIGMQIGAEWSKDRSTTLIHTATLSVWAEALQAGAAAGQAETVTDAVTADVGALLSGELPEAAISRDRYGIAFDVALGDE